MFRDKHDLELAACVSLSDKPPSRWFGCMRFARVNEIRTIMVHEALLNLILRDVVFGREFLLNLR